MLAKFGVSEFVIANLLNVTARLDAVFFIIRTRKLKTLGKWPGVPSIWLDGICVLASLNPTREFDEGIFDDHCCNVLFFQGSLNEPIFLNSSIYHGKECDFLNSIFKVCMFLVCCVSKIYFWVMGRRYRKRELWTGYYSFYFHAMVQVELRLLYGSIQLI